MNPLDYSDNHSSLKFWRILILIASGIFFLWWAYDLKNPFPVGFFLAFYWPAVHYFGNLILASYASAYNAARTAKATEDMRDLMAQRAGRPISTAARAALDSEKQFQEMATAVAPKPA